MGWRIVAHSFSLLFRNFREALKVSVFPVVVLLLFVWLVFGISGAGMDIVMLPEAGAMTPGAAFGIILSLVAFIVVSAWVAVLWHRFILKEEYPGVVPVFHRDRVLAYCGRSIQLGLIMILVMFPVVMVFGIALGILGIGESGAATLVSGFAAGLIFTYIWLRIALVLPATAVGRPMRIGESWSATARLSNDIVSAAAIIVALNMAAGILGGLLPLPAILGALVEVAISWVTVMVGTSLLTTLYGHLVEGRPLP